MKPWSIEGALGLGMIRGDDFGDLRLGVGLALGRAQIRLGYRALFGPTSHLGGPEAALSAWF